MNNVNNTTICAPATGQGGAINIVRVSGPKAIEIVSSIFKAKKKDFELTDSNSHEIHFGDLLEDDKVLDEVLVSVFKDNKSYTGEPSVEISLHASPYIMQQTLNLLIKNGAQMAEPGEFSMRAFLNGKLDLAQAEAVGDLIAATSKSAHNTAMRQLKGEFSKRLKILRQQLLDFASLIELELDFAEEDVEFADREKFINLVNEINTEVEQLIYSFKIGNVLKKGVPVAIVGKPNVGKSTLLNSLLKEDRAIVSDIAGTTRDIIEDTINIEGVLFRFIDTAGIRQSSDTIESLGIERTYKKINEANIVLILLDASEIETADDIFKHIKESEIDINNSEQEYIIVINKIDKSPINFNTDNFDKKVLTITAKSEESIKKLEESLTEYIHQFNIEDNSIITNSRHLEALQHTAVSLKTILEGFEFGLSTDLIAIDVRTALYHLGSITNEVSNDELLGNIFGRFCIGK
jgi:tRNA modification GTPase